MKTSPIYIFEDETSTGVYSVPESGFILIRKLSTEDEPLIITKVSNTFSGPFDDNTPISEFLLNFSDVPKTSLQRMRYHRHRTLIVILYRRPL